MSTLSTSTPASDSREALAPGSVVQVRDETWLVTNVARSVDGFRIKVRGLSDYVRNEEATFFTALDRIEVLDPKQVEVIADDSAGYRRARLWLETTLLRDSRSVLADEIGEELRGLPAVLIWPQLKIAMLYDQQTEEEAAAAELKNDGWTLFAAEGLQVEGIPSALLKED